MHPDTVKAALQFLSRVDLKGSEAFAFVSVVQALNKFIEPETPIPTADTKD